MSVYVFPDPQITFCTPTRRLRKILGIWAMLPQSCSAFERSSQEGAQVLGCQLLLLFFPDILTFIFKKKINILNVYLKHLRQTAALLSIYEFIILELHILMFAYQRVSVNILIPRRSFVGLLFTFRFVDFSSQLWWFPGFLESPQLRLKDLPSGEAPGAYRASFQQKMLLFCFRPMTKVNTRAVGSIFGGVFRSGFKAHE